MRSNNFQLTADPRILCPRRGKKINGLGHLSVVHSTNRALAEEVAIIAKLTSTDRQFAWPARSLHLPLGARCYNRKNVPSE
jgi:hypothetical protein